MRRPEQHQIDSQGKALLREVFARLGWATNEISEDYGRDFDVEVFRGNQSTGIIFGVQLKSSRAPAYSAAQSFLSHVIGMDSAVYLAKELRYPVALVVADVSQRRLFWATPQIDELFLKSIEGETKTATIRIPVANELPESGHHLIRTIGQIETILASRRLQKIPVADFAHAVRERDDFEALSRALRDKSDYLDARSAEKLIAAGDVDSARIRIGEILSSERSSIESKFFCLLVEEKLELITAVRAERPQMVLPKIALTSSDRMQRLTKKGPRRLKFFALACRIGAEAFSLAFEDFGLYQMWKNQESHGDPLVRASLQFQRAAVQGRVLRKYAQFCRLATYAYRVPYRSTAFALLRIKEAIALFVGRLELEGFSQDAREYRTSALNLYKFAADLAKIGGDEETVSQSAAAAAMLARNVAEDSYQWALTEVQGIGDPKIQQWGHSIMSSHAQRLQGRRPLEDSYQNAGPRLVYENMAAALGIDVSDPSDYLGQLVQNGIADLDPSRVLKDCEHLFITLGKPGLLAGWLRLPTMADKVVHCTLFKHSATATALNDAYADLREEHCNCCEKRSPRLPSWRYSPEWQNAENRRHKDLLGYAH